MFTLKKGIPLLEIDLFSGVVNRPWPHSSQTNQHKFSRSFSNEFQAPVSTDLTAPGTVCDWCGQSAERRLTAVGGRMHNQTGAFCSPCGQLFLEKIVNS